MAEYVSAGVTHPWQVGYVAPAKGAYVSPKQKGKGGRPVVDAETRWQRKTRINRKTKCIEWKGKLNRYGKGTFFADGKQYDHQDYAWMREKGSLPDTMLKITCKTEGCVNVDHLEPAKPRRNREKQNAFDEDDVVYIRREYDRGRSVIDIAKEFPKASEQSVMLVARRKSYLWVVDQQTNKE